jgi:hypothetical protein
LKWFEAGYSDENWATGRSGFSTPGGYGEVTQLADYSPSTYQTVFFRREFAVRDPVNVAEVFLRVDYDDGIVAYLNGQEVLRRGITGAPGTPVPVDAMALYHPSGSGELLAIPGGAALLRPGTNLLAVQLHGSGTNDYSMTFELELLANVSRGPYVQNTTTRSTQIIWQTPTAATSEIEYGTNTTVLQRVPVAQNVKEHAATITELKDNTEYFYRLINRFGAKETISDWRSFRTFRESGPVTFNVVGDSGWGSVAQLQVAEDMRNSPADFLMHVGDMVYYSITARNADLRVFSIYTEEMQRRPWYLALGNHDMYWDTNAALQCFYLPTNSVTGTEHYYAFDHGDAHITVAWSDLQAGASYAPGSPQYEWLDADLGRTQKPWKFLFFHHTWRTSSLHQGDDYDENLVRDSQQLDEGLAQLAREHGVQIVFHGHDHCYERMAPSGGPISFVTGGGGSSPYPLLIPHPDSVQFYSAYHFLRVQVNGNETLVEAVGLGGNVFDKVHVKRTFPEGVEYQSTWNTPVIESEPTDDLDGNIVGQVFDFRGDALTAPMGNYTSAGRIFVNNDRTNVYLGLDEVMLRAGEELVVFLEVPSLRGRTNMANFGDGFLDTTEGVDTLDFLSNLAFTNFSPSIAIVLGDELGDGVSRQFRRMGQEFSSGQGAFYLADGASEVEEQRLAQFNRSPQISGVSYEQNADFVEVALPYRVLGDLKPGDLIRVGAITALRNVNTNAAVQSRDIDAAAIGYSLTRTNGMALLEGVRVRLAGTQDADGDGLSDQDEASLGTDRQRSDTDDDGISDGWEVSYGSNPKFNDAGVDEDGDGLTELMEFRAGTNPLSESSRLWLQTRVEDGRVCVAWSAVPGREYQMQRRETLTRPFRDVAAESFPRIAQGSLESYWIDLAEVGRTESEYYRVRLLD